MKFVRYLKMEEALKGPESCEAISQRLESFTKFFAESLVCIEQMNDAGVYFIVNLFF